MSSSDAPPPVEMCFISAATSAPACVHRGRAVAAADDREGAATSAIARATPNVPARERRPSRRGPSGRSRRSSSRRRSASRRARRVFGPMSSAIVAVGDRVDADDVARSARRALSATTTSTGKSTSTPASRAFSRIVRASASLSLFDLRRLHVRCPCAARNVFAIAPPMTSASTFSRSDSTTAILSRHLRAAEHGDVRLLRRRRRACRAPRSPSRAGSRSRARARASASAWTDACARWTAPNASST